MLIKLCRVITPNWKTENKWIINKDICKYKLKVSLIKYINFGLFVLQFTVT